MALLSMGSAQWIRAVIVLLMQLMLLAFGGGCGVAVRQVHHGVRALASHDGRSGPLTPREQAWAATAWHYFESNLQPASGLVNAIDTKPTVSMWQVADYLAAMTAARELKLLTPQQFDERFRRVLHFLNAMPLLEDEVPNRTYDPSNWQMIDAAGKPGVTGGSAIDMGRLLVWLRIVRDRYPSYAEYIDRVVLRWNFCHVMASDALQQGMLQHEGRLGYQQYAALGFQLWGFDTTTLSRIERVERVNVFGVPLLVDARDPQHPGKLACVEMLPYALLGIELGWHGTDAPFEGLADAVYHAQEQRFQRERVLTARTDHPSSEPPFYVHDAVFAVGSPFNTIDEGGTFHPEKALVATRAAFGMWVLWDKDYTTRLMDVIEPLQRQDRGWFEGRYEQTGGAEELLTASTNATVLEALLYKTTGVLFQQHPQAGLFDVTVKNEFTRPAHCLPAIGPAGARP
jgi:hypothetical protein